MLVQLDKIFHRVSAGFITVIADSDQALVISNTRALKCALIALEPCKADRRILQRSTNHCNARMTDFQQLFHRVEGRTLMINIDRRNLSAFIRGGTKHDRNIRSLEGLQMLVRNRTAHK
ncbi:hypothetical protein D3C80_1496340 [compost metagenome]